MNNSDALAYLKRKLKCDEKKILNEAKKKKGQNQKNNNNFAVELWLKEGQMRRGQNRILNEMDKWIWMDENEERAEIF